MVRGEVEKKMVEGGEVEIFLGEVEVGEENGRMEKVGEFGGKKRKEGKRKRKKGKDIEKRRYSLGRKSGNNYSGGFPGFGCGCGNLSGKYRIRPEIKYLGTTRNKYQKSRILY